MSRAAKTVLLGALLAIALGIGAYVCAMQMCQRQVASDDLAWLKREFGLSAAEMQRVRQLHEGYLPKCQKMCSRIAAKQQEVEAAIAHGESPDNKLMEMGSLRGQCQAQMLKHFQDVSKAMPPEQGKRYLAEMQRVTLGFHQDFERSMGDLPAGQHGHGEH